VQAEMDSEVPKVDTRRAYLGARRTRQRTGSDPVGAPIRYGEGTARCTCLSAEEAIQRFQVGTWEAGVE